MKTLKINAIAVAGIALLVGLGTYTSQAGVFAPTLVTDQEFVSPGKATAAVSMTHNFSATPAVGQPLELELVFASAQDDTMQLQIKADDALAAGPPVSRAVSNGQRVVVNLVPQAEGRYYVNVMARVGSGDRARARAFSLAVQVGKGSYRSTAKKAAVSPNGERLIRMQAKEKPAD